MSDNSGDGGPAPILEAHHITKQFGGIVAVDDVDLAVSPGEIHGLVGENGAGKSTLMRILAGILRPDRGEVLVDGSALDAGNARDAIDAGVSLVHQELSLVPEMTVAENILLGAAPTRWGFTKTAEVRQVATAALDEIGVAVDLDEPVIRLSVALRQFVEIARAVARRPRVLILDEPTATLTPAETTHLLEMLQRLADRGLAIIYISHRIPEIFAICDRVTILRDGTLVDQRDIAELTPETVVDQMVGRELGRDLRTHREAVGPGQVMLSARGIRAPGVNGVDLDLRAGEIVGLGGLVGAGRTELVRSIIGADPRTSGTVLLSVGGRLAPLRSYPAAVAGGLAYIPEERRSDGLALTMTVSENVALPSRQEMSQFGVLRFRRIAAFTQGLAEAVGLRPPEIHRDAGDFSGGNQQKVVLAKWLGRTPTVIVLDEPTRGVDVGAKVEIHNLIKDLANDGAAVLVISSDLPELLELSDVIHVVRDGRIVGTLPRDAADERRVMSLAAGSEVDAA